MSSQRNKLQEDTRFRILQLLEEDPQMSQRALAHEVGVSLGSTHYVLSALIEKGFVKLANFTASENKRRYAYILTPKGIREKASLTREFLKRKRTEYEALRLEIERLEAELGRRGS